MEIWQKIMKALWPFELLLCVGMISYLFGVFATPDIQSSRRARHYAAPSAVIPQNKVENEEQEFPRPKKILRKKIEEEGAIPNQRVIIFKDKASLNAFLAKLGGNLRLLGRLDELDAMLIGFLNEDDLLALLDGTEEMGAIFPVQIPDFGGAPQAGAEPLGNGLLEWLGVSSDNSQWGKGVKIAILDTGISEHVAFKVGIEHINLVDLPSDLSKLNGHGTAVASLIFSTDPSAPGIAPSATPLSVRIADDQGMSNSFLIAKGIMVAVDAGASLINISMGGAGESSLVKKALAHAERSGVLVIAAAGNSGMQGVMQPAAHPSVVAVGAVDAINQAMNFSTTGKEVAMSAPGYKVNVAYTGNALMSANGTSFSAPIVTGTIAAAMSHGTAPRLSPRAAYTSVANNLRDIGSVGHDFQTGAGVPDLGRIIYGNSNAHDASINSITRQGNQATVIVQNLGSQTLINTAVFLNVNGINTQSNITSLPPGRTQVINVPIREGQANNISGNVRISGAFQDFRSGNNSYSISIPK